jgi:hypothetical protein
MLLSSQFSPSPSLLLSPMFRYAHGGGCPWERITIYTATFGGLRCLKYAVENGLILDERLLDRLTERLELTDDLEAHKLVEYIQSVGRINNET